MFITVHQFRPSDQNVEWKQKCTGFTLNVRWYDSVIHNNVPNIVLLQKGNKMATTSHCAVVLEFWDFWCDQKNDLKNNLWISYRNLNVSHSSVSWQWFSSQNPSKINSCRILEWAICSNKVDCIGILWFGAEPEQLTSDLISYVLSR